jgi:hypothetical protein
MNFMIDESILKKKSVQYKTGVNSIKKIIQFNTKLVAALDNHYKNLHCSQKYFSLLEFSYFRR